jgi:hypothetical protein
MHAQEEEAEPLPCGRSAAEEFLLTVLTANAEEREEASQGLVVSRRENDKSVSFSAGSWDTRTMGGGMGGMGAGGAVHASGFSK